MTFKAIVKIKSFPLFFKLLESQSYAPPDMYNIHLQCALLRAFEGTATGPS